MDSSSAWIFVDALQRLSKIPFYLFTALMFPKVFYSSLLSRCLTLTFIAFETTTIFRPHEITNIMILYLTGFGASLFLIWSTIMLLFYNPLRDFRRLRSVVVKAKNNSDVAITYEWESYPAKISLQRISWVLDLLINLRGVGWSFRKPNYPLPPPIQNLYEEIGIDITSSHPQSKPTRGNTLTKSSFLKTHVFLLITRYILVDLCITLMDLSPFFQDSSSPMTYIFPLSPQNILLAPYNALLATIGVYAVLDLYSTCISLINVFLFGPNILGIWGEYFMYPRLWGPLSAVWNEGIIGFWGGYWHDLFKHAFLAFTRGCMPEQPNSDQSTRGYKMRKILRLNGIFVLSGLCHATASYMQAARTYPFLTFLSFAVQGVGISLQQLLSSFLEKKGVGERVKKGMVLGLSVVWAYGTMYVFLGDLAASGAFRLKLVPVSVIGLGLGRRWPGWVGN